MVKKQLNILSFYENAGLLQANEMIKAASLAYKTGDLSFADLSQYLAQAIDIQKNYLEAINLYNHSVIQYHYYLNQ